jgi:hypothetical protein
MDQPDFKVHSIKVGHQPSFNASGTQTVQKTLTYHVGPHGPFYHTYGASDGTADQMKSDIQAQVAELQSLHQLAG